MMRSFRRRLALAAWLAVVLACQLLLPGRAAAWGEPNPQRSTASPLLVLIAVQGDGQTHHLPDAPAAFLADAVQTATIQVVYQGTWTESARQAFEYAKHIWETQITSPVVIKVNARWEDLSQWGTGVLGGANAVDIWSNFSSTVPRRDTWYPTALANKIAGSDLNDKDGYDSDGDGKDLDAEIAASFNSARTDWYYGTDGKPPVRRYDLVSVILHELAHGLGFVGSMTVSGGQASWGYSNGSGANWPLIYDVFAVNQSGQNLIATYGSSPLDLAVQLQGNNLFFNGPNAIAANKNARPKLYAPAGWQQGSSFVHLDEKTYPYSSGNSLMTPQLTDGEAVHDPGAIVRGIFTDLGWTIVKYKPAAYLPLVRKVTPTQPPPP